MSEDILAQIDAIRGGGTRSAWLQRLIDRELNGQPTTPAAALPLPAGEPCPGAVCAGPGCWNRDTARYGLRQLPLCPACRAALEGQERKRQMPASAARLARRGAA